MLDEIRNIKSIQVFMAVYQSRNVTRAARQMNSSQSSVSYHIKKLEDSLGVALFQRRANGLEATEEGHLLAKHVDRGLSSIRMGLDMVVRRAGAVRIALLPMFASRWFSSRIGGFLEANPDVRLSIQNHNNSYATIDYPERTADLGIQWGRGKWDRFQVTKLWPERLVVVCSPGYQRRRAIRTPGDLSDCTLLHVDDTRMWDEWFAQNGLMRQANQPEMMLEDRHFQLSSTINGLGVSLFAAWLVEAELAAGALVNPFGRLFETSFAYHVIRPRAVEPPKAALKLLEWIRESSAADSLADTTS